jgi:hypothetical protein
MIGGEWVAATPGTEYIDIHDPSTQRVLTKVPKTDFATMTKIVDRAQDAFLEWRETSVLRRQGVMLSYVIPLSYAPFPIVDLFFPSPRLFRVVFKPLSGSITMTSLTLSCSNKVRHLLMQRETF